MSRLTLLFGANRPFRLRFRRGPSRASREHQFRGPADAWSKTPTTVPGPKYCRHRTRRSPFKILILNTYYRQSGFCPGEWRYLWLIYLRHEDHDHCVAANGGIRVKYTPIAPIRSLTHTPGRGRACANEGMRGRSRVQRLNVSAVHWLHSEGCARKLRSKKAGGNGRK